MKLYYLHLSILLSCFLLGCTPKIPIVVPTTTSTFYEEEIKQWQKERLASLTSADSWLSLAGLFWLKEGKNTFGSSQLNNIVFPSKTPTYIGHFMLENDSVTMKIDEKIAVTVDSIMPKSILLNPDISGEPTIANFESLTWLLIKREDRFAIRLKDAKNDAFDAFKGVKYFDIDKKWQVPAKLIPAKGTKSIVLKNVIDMDVTAKLDGYLRFELDGATYELEAMDGGPDSYFIIFSDETTGMETYGAGRYLYVPRVDDRGNTIIDFNKSYNPPCAFTDFATCPLPSEKNHLEIAVRGGELHQK